MADETEHPLLARRLTAAIGALVFTGLGITLIESDEVWPGFVICLLSTASVISLFWSPWIDRLIRRKPYSEISSSRAEMVVGAIVLILTIIIPALLLPPQLRIGPTRTADHGDLPLAASPATLPQPYIYLAYLNTASISRWTFNQGMIEVGLSMTNYTSSPNVVSRSACSIWWGTRSEEPPESHSSFMNGYELHPIVELDRDPLLPPGGPARQVSCSSGWPENRADLVGNDPQDVQKRREALNEQDLALWIVGSIMFSDGAHRQFLKTFCAVSEYGDGPVKEGGTDWCNKTLPIPQ